MRPDERKAYIKRISETKAYKSSRRASRRAIRETSNIWRIARSFVRDYTALSIVIVGAIMVTLLNLRVTAEDGSWITRILGGSTPRYSTAVITPKMTGNLATAPIPVGAPRDSGVKVQPTIQSFDEASLAYAAPYGADIQTDENDIEIYTVQNGDTIGQIARDHGVTIDTILWANEIDDVTRIKPGDTIIILATSGVQHKVAKGDTIEKIAKKYKGSVEAIISYNGLPANGELSVGDEIVIPDGIKEEIVKPKPVIAPRTYTAVASVKSSYYAPPVYGYRRTQGLHRTNAVDLAAPMGTPIYASAPGTVVIARKGWNGGYGTYIVIQHPNGTKTLYAHHSKLKVKVGQKVKRGQLIALMGSTGRSTGPHIHFEVRGARNPY